MSVERSSAPSTPKAASGSEAGHVKGKGHPAAAGGSAEPGGFSSLLTMLGSDEAGDIHVDQDVAGQALQGQGAPLDPAVLLAQAIQVPSGLPATPETNIQLGSAQRAEADSLLKKVGRDPRQSVATELNPAADTTADGTSLAAKELGTQMQAALNDGAQDALKEVPLAHHGAPKSHLPDDARQSDKARIAAEEHAHKFLREENKVSQSAALPQVTLAAGAGEGGFKQAERVKERLALKQIGGSEGGAWGHQALVQAGRIEPPAATSGASGLSPEMMVAEQVNYWIGRDVQNAELKLDGMGEGSIKVNISLTGNEARVEFRTDQAQARQVLEGAVSHLKDLLGNEGLVLSSVLVGSSNSGAADSREGRPPAHSRQAAIAVPDILVQDAVARPATLSGRTVDLFV